jgi:hypothetical protein
VGARSLRRRFAGTTRAGASFSFGHASPTGPTSPAFASRSCSRTIRAKVARCGPLGTRRDKDFACEACGQEADASASVGNVGTASWRSLLLPSTGNDDGLLRKPPALAAGKFTHDLNSMKPEVAPGTLLINVSYWDWDDETRA